MIADTSRSGLWELMLEHSFSPRQWFDLDSASDELDDFEDVTPEKTLMWVYRKGAEGTYLVGFYTPDREWHEDTRCLSQTEAAERVHWLNGGR